MIRLLTLLCALTFVTPAVAGEVDGCYSVGATVVVKDNQVVRVSKITILPLCDCDLNRDGIDIYIPQASDTEACEGGICIAPPAGRRPCPGPCNPVIGPDGQPQRVYMIYHPTKDKYLGTGIIGGLVNWVDASDAIILPNRVTAQKQIDGLLGSKNVVELKAFLLLPVNVR